jgi:putative transposase
VPSPNRFWDDTEVVPPLMERDGREHPVHLPPSEGHNTPVIVFLTVCTKDRKRILDQTAVHDLLRSAWQTRPTWLVGRYVIMPNHIHLFCAPAVRPAQSLEKWVNFWKSNIANHWPQPSEQPIWQRHFWDTQLRRHENYESKWEYVRQNPVRIGLVQSEEEWPYQGELNVLAW